MTAIDVIFATTSQHSPVYSSSESLKDLIPIYGNVSIGRLKNGTVWKYVYEACTPQGIPAKLPVPQFGAAYAFINKCPSKLQSDDWDVDGVLKITLALSRLIHPTSTGFEYAAHVRFADDESIERIVPARVHGLGMYAFVSPRQESQNRLTQEDAVSLATLCKAFYSVLEVLPERIKRALWLHEYASWTNDAGIRWALIVTGLEALVNTGTNKTSTQFKVRIDNLARGFQLDISRTKADKAYDLRSCIVHGRTLQQLTEKQLDLYDELDKLLRESVKKAIVDESFRKIFESNDEIKSKLGEVPDTCQR